MTIRWLTFLVLSAASSMQALPLGNPWEASLQTDGVFCKGKHVKYCDPGSSCGDAWSFRFGYYGDFVFNRHMEVDSTHASLHRTQLITQAGYLVFNLWDRFDLFSTLGFTKISIATPSKTFSSPPPNNYTYLETDSHFSWSFGARTTVWEYKCFGLGVEGQYFSARPLINYTQREGLAAVYNDKKHLSYHEWQIGFGAAYRISILCDATALIPYTGIKWSRSLMNTGNYAVVSQGQVFLNTESERRVAFVAGLTLVGCNKITVTAEGRFGGEAALYINSQLRF